MEGGREWPDNDDSSWYTRPEEPEFRKEESDKPGILLNKKLKSFQAFSNTGKNYSSNQWRKDWTPEET